jgi:hypothetical protein
MAGTQGGSREEVQERMTDEMCLEDRLQGLALVGEEEEELDFSEEIEGLIKDIR